jgi:hypothetical protein
MRKMTTGMTIKRDC